MDMIGHQAICVNLASKFFFPFPQIIDVEKIVFIRDENYLPIMASLDYMMRITRYYYSRASWHKQPYIYRTLQEELSNSVQRYHTIMQHRWPRRPLQ